MLRAKIADALQELQRMDNHSSRTLQQRLNNYGCNLRIVALENLREMPDTIDVALGPAPADRTAEAIGGMGTQDRECHVPESIREH